MHMMAHLCLEIGNDELKGRQVLCEVGNRASKLDFEH